MRRSKQQFENPSRPRNLKSYLFFLAFSPRFRHEIRRRAFNKIIVPDQVEIGLDSNAELKTQGYHRCTLAIPISPIKRYYNRTRFQATSRQVNEARGPHTCSRPCSFEVKQTKKNEIPPQSKHTTKSAAARRPRPPLNGLR